MGILIILGVLMLLIGLAVQVFKWYFLLPGYQALTVEMKGYVDVHSMAKFTALGYYFNAGLLLVSGVIDYSGIQINPLAIAIIVLSTLIFISIFVQRYNGNLFDDQHHLIWKSVKNIILPISVFSTIWIIVCGLCLWLL